MKRRNFVKNVGALGLGITLGPGANFLNGRGRIMTVLGEISPEELGVTLMHEHVMADFIGAKLTGPHRYDRDEVVKTVLPHLFDLKRLGCKTLVECTATFLGRDAELAKRLSIESGLHIITNTGNYAALEEKFLPDYAYRESAEELSQRWMDEWDKGIGDTEIYPGIIKIGVDNGPLNSVARKLVKAAALTHLKTGLSISAHTGNGEAALEQLGILADHGVGPRAFRWVHAQNEGEISYHTRVADMGAYIEFDGIRPDNIDENVQRVMYLRDQGFLDRILISQDAGWYWVGEPGGGTFAPYTPILEKFVPALMERGLSKKEIDHLLIDNPRTSLMINVREN